MRDGRVADLAALERLAEALDDDARRAVVAVRRADYAHLMADFPGVNAAAERAVALAEAAGTPAVAVKAYSLWALALAALAQSAAARTRAEAGLDLARAIGDQVSAANALYALANVSWPEGDYLAARDYLEQTLSIFRETGDRRGEGRVLGDLGFIAYHGLNDYTTARACFEESLRICRAIGDRWGEGWRIASLGHVAQDEGNYSLALTYTEQSLQILRPIDSQAGEHLNTLGEIARMLGDYATAQRYYTGYLHYTRTIGSQPLEVFALANSALPPPG
jgi:tetratricopeptide (TPR) repeat protein